MPIDSTTPARTTNTSVQEQQKGPSLGSAAKPADNPQGRAGSEWGYSAYQAPLFGGSNRVSASDVVQAGSHVGDCYMLADLQVLAGLNSNFIEDHVKEVANPNDSQHPNFQVTLYKEGKPFDVFVDGKQMLNPASRENLGSGAGSLAQGQGPSTSMWPSLYEKAYAIATGKSIAELDADSPITAWQTLTGSGGTAASPIFTEPGDFAKMSQEAQQQKKGFVVSTVDRLLPSGDGASTGSRTLGNGRYSVSPDISGLSAHVVDTQSPNQQSWDVPLGHIMNVKSVSSLDSEHPDPATVTDPNKLVVNIENPWGPSATNQQNLQGLPYTVLQNLCKGFAKLDAPKNK